MIGVYTLTHPSTGLYYIGSTDNYDRRQIEHMSRLKIGTHNNDRVQQAYQLSNDFTWSFKEVDTKEQAISLEREMIVMNKDDPNMANYRLAKPVDSETRQRMSDAHKASWTDERRLAKSQEQTGRIHTEETKRKIGEAHKGKPLPSTTLSAAAEKNRKGVIVSGVEYRTASEAAIALDVHVSTVLNRARNPSEKWADWQISEKEH